MIVKVFSRAKYTRSGPKNSTVLRRVLSVNFLLYARKMMEDMIIEESHSGFSNINNSFAHLLYDVERYDIHERLEAWIRDFGATAQVIWDHCNVIFCDNTLELDHIVKNSHLVSDKHISIKHPLYDYLLFVSYIDYEKLLVIFGSLSREKFIKLFEKNHYITPCDLDIYLDSFDPKQLQILHPNEVYYIQQNDLIFNPAPNQYEDVVFKKSCQYFDTLINSITSSYYKSEDEEIVTEEIASIRSFLATYPNSPDRYVLEEELECLKMWLTKRETSGNVAELKSAEDRIKDLKKLLRANPECKSEIQPEIRRLETWVRKENERASYASSLENLLSNKDPGFVTYESFMMNKLLATRSSAYMKTILSAEKLKLERTIDQLLKCPESVFASFVSQWFSGLVKAKKYTTDRYCNVHDKHRLDPLFSSDGNNKVMVNFLIKTTNQIKKFYEIHYPDQSLPTIFFVGPAEYICDYSSKNTCNICNNSECKARLPEDGGEVCFTRLEMKQYLVTYFEKTFLRDIDIIKMRTKVQMYDLWQDNYMNKNSWPKHKSPRSFSSYKLNGLLSKYRPKYNDNNVSNKAKQEKDFKKAVSALCTALSHSRRFEYEGFMLTGSQCTDEFIQTCTNNIQHVSEEDVLTILNNSMQNNPGSDKTGYHPSVGDATRNEIAKLTFDTAAQIGEHIETYWAPCMIMMVRNSHGSSHLKYLNRLKLSGYIYALGYTEWAAQCIWYYVFRNTNIIMKNNLDLNQFLTTKQGQVIVYEYKSNNPEKRIGLGCMNMASNDLCPFTSDKIADIEDLVVRQGIVSGCQEQCNKHRKNTSDKYHLITKKLHSPYDYTSIVVETKFIENIFN